MTSTNGVHIGYYVSVINGRKRGLLLGPYDTHAEALDNVRRGEQLANDLDAWSDFYAYGTCKYETPNALPTGRLGR